MKVSVFSRKENVLSFFVIQLFLSRFFCIFGALLAFSLPVKVSLLLFYSEKNNEKNKKKSRDPSVKQNPKNV